MLNTVQIIFDNQLDRPIRRVHDHLVAPELVKNYTISAKNEAGGWTKIASIQGNARRRRVHTFDAIKTTELKIDILETNGIESARVYEVRVYLENENQPD